MGLFVSFGPADKLISIIDCDVHLKEPVFCQL